MQDPLSFPVVDEHPIIQTIAACPIFIFHASLGYSTYVLMVQLDCRPCEGRGLGSSIREMRSVM